jgi:hypothetical protein
METDNQQQKQQEDSEDFARGLMLTSMLGANKLNYEMLNAEEGKIVLTAVQAMAGIPPGETGPVGARMIE